jgi:hypothetical protein
MASTFGNDLHHTGSKRSLNAINYTIYIYHSGLRDTRSFASYKLAMIPDLGLHQAKLQSCQGEAPSLYFN